MYLDIMSLFLFITAGFPGTGKTTLSHALAKRGGFVHLIGDKIRNQITAGKPVHDMPETLRMIAALNQQAEEALAQGKSVICDVNFLKQKDRASCYAMAKTHGAQPMTLWFECSLQLALERNAGRSPSDVFFNDTRADTVCAMYAAREPLEPWENGVVVHSARSIEENVREILETLTFAYGA